MGSPSSEIFICSGVRLNKSQNHTIWFDTPGEQVKYFTDKVVKVFNGYTFLRKTWSIKVAEPYENACTWNYLFFRNGSEQKLYFYFIDRVEYLNDNTVELFLILDVMQTYRFDYGMLDCFVEREHSATDNIGDNLLDEGLELGDFVVEDKINIDLGDLCVLLASNIHPSATVDSGNEVRILGSNLGGVYSGLAVFGTLCDAQGLTALSDILNHKNFVGYSDSIVSMWMFPTDFIKLQDGTWSDGKACKIVNGTKTLTKRVRRNDDLKGYTPKNNKLFTYPYNFLYISNNNGLSASYHYEYFSDPTIIEFNLFGCPLPEGQLKLIPLNYKNESQNNEEGLMGPTFPTCAWNQDVYKMWLAQNQNQHYMTNVQGVVSAGTGLVNLFTSFGQNGLNEVSSGVNSILNQIAQKKDAEMQAPHSKGSQSSNVNIMTGNQTYTVIRKCIDNTHARIIDDYFTMYGYKCNKVKKPNHCVRENFTYVKTTNCQIHGVLPNEDLVAIQNIYDKGITFWVDGDKIGDYSVSNNCK